MLYGSPAFYFYSWDLGMGPTISGNARDTTLSDYFVKLIYDDWVVIIVPWILSVCSIYIQHIFHYLRRFIIMSWDFWLNSCCTLVYNWSIFLQMGLWNRPESFKWYFLMAFSNGFSGPTLILFLLLVNIYIWLHFYLSNCDLKIRGVIELKLEFSLALFFFSSSICKKRRSRNFYYLFSLF